MTSAFGGRHSIQLSYGCVARIIHKLPAAVSPVLSRSDMQCMPASAPAPLSSLSENMAEPSLRGCNQPASIAFSLSAHRPAEPAGAAVWRYRPAICCPAADPARLQALQTPLIPASKPVLQPVAGLAFLPKLRQIILPPRLPFFYTLPKIIILICAMLRALLRRPIPCLI